ncbi:DNA polymerase-4 [Ereboglobus sp. PH5-5]|uniref:Y-family DNA polymerase n=1 Tax=Ereboglobus sp. PH5-5 TaxID=2940529 RepID=UPI002404B2FB|nr:DNA polymerase IV [Ereboglobus sp. PH5-5]MDF9832483.1 DNA polymerase-4 [Ereboglobus sp. PH5-5]
MPPLPTIVHLDADAFFVSVEQALDPTLKGKKVAVGGRERGIISSASYEARACGVYTPMPTARALNVCPDLILVRGCGRYGEFSRRLFDLCEELTPLVERRSIDEGYIDLTPCGFKTREAVVAAVRGLQKKITDTIDVPVSFGLATNKLVSALASKLYKPRGFIVVDPGDEAAFVAPLAIGKLPGIGPKTEKALKEQGIARVSDVLALPEGRLQAIFGDGWRDMLATCRGEDDSPVVTEFEDAKSYSQQETFARDIGDFAEIERVAKGMIDALMREIRADGKRVRTITVKVRHPNFEQASAGHSLPQSTNLEQPFYPWVAPLLKQAWQKRRAPLRLVSVKLSGVDNGPEQMDLFGAQTDEKRQRLAGVVDALNAATRRHGTPAVIHGSQLKKP